MTWLLAIDPGPTESAWVELRDGRPVAFAKEANDAVLRCIESCPSEFLAVEMIAGYGMPVGAEVFDTAVWAGRFMQRWLDGRQGQGGVDWTEDTIVRVYRKAVKLHLCGSTRAKDPNVRQALIDRYGPGKPAAIGLKASPGPLYGVSGDVWAALAVAVTAADQLAVEPLPPAEGVG